MAIATPLIMHLAFEELKPFKVTLRMAELVNLKKMALSDWVYMDP